MSTTTADVAARSRPMTAEERKVIIASSAGTIFEWYDFYLYGSLAAIIGAQFFSAYPEATRNIFALFAFAAGFLVRPFGALVFGRLGDLIGRKHTFLITILIMGLSTFLVGCLPSYDTIGTVAPVALIVLRMAQGLALGGEYGGAAIYVAEHAPQNRRGYYTSFIQTTATLGLLLSLIVIMFTQIYVNANWPEVTTAAGTKLTPFAAWGWRIPFLVSIFLLGISLYIRLQMNESPAFKKMKDEGSLSKAPLSEAFGQWKNAKIAILALLGLTAGQAVVWYTGQFYALFFLQSILKVDNFTANVLVAWSLDHSAPAASSFFGCAVGQDRPQADHPRRLPASRRSPIFPLFKLMTATANPALARPRRRPQVTVIADPARLLVPVQPDRHGQVHQLVRHRQGGARARCGEVRPRIDGPPARAAKVKIGDKRSLDAKDRRLRQGRRRGARRRPAIRPPTTRLSSRSRSSRRTASGTSSRCSTSSSAQKLTLIGILTILVIYVTMVYGPIAAALVELFPTRIRYSGLSLPYHIGNGWFGGMLPATSFAMVAQTGDIYYGLWYPIVVAVMTVVIGLLFVPETYKRDIFKD